MYVPADDGDVSLDGVRKLRGMAWTRQSRSLHFCERDSHYNTWFEFFWVYFPSSAISGQSAKICYFAKSLKMRQDGSNCLLLQLDSHFFKGRTIKISVKNKKYTKIVYIGQFEFQKSQSVLQNGSIIWTCQTDTSKNIFVSDLYVNLNIPDCVIVVVYCRAICCIYVASELRKIWRWYRL
jgi:hypothetical protein